MGCEEVRREFEYLKTVQNNQLATFLQSNSQDPSSTYERDFPHCMTTLYDPGIDAYICTGHTTELDERMPYLNRVETFILFNYIFFRTGDSTTRLIHTIYCDFSLHINTDMVAKMIFKKRAKIRDLPCFASVIIPLLLENV